MLKIGAVAIITPFVACTLHTRYAPLPPKSANPHKISPHPFSVRLSWDSPLQTAQQVMPCQRLSGGRSVQNFWWLGRMTCLQTALQVFSRVAWCEPYLWCACWHATRLPAPVKDKFSCYSWRRMFQTYKMLCPCGACTIQSLVYVPKTQRCSLTKLSHNAAPIWHSWATRELDIQQSDKCLET